MELILVNIGTRWPKMHSKARAFLQPTRANIHQYQFNNPIIHITRVVPEIREHFDIFCQICYTELLFGTQQNDLFLNINVQL